MRFVQLLSIVPDTYWSRIISFLRINTEIDFIYHIRPKKNKVETSSFSSFFKPSFPQLYAKVTHIFIKNYNIKY